MRAQESALESTFQKIARIISQQYDLKVEVRGTKAYIDFNTRTIVLPSLDSDVVKGVTHILDGLLDHETAHGLFTDGDLLQRAKPDPDTHNIWNAIEDSFIERKMSAKFIGCGQNLKKANQILFKRVDDNWSKMEPWPKLMGAIALCLERGDSFERYLNDPHIGQMIKLIIPEIEQAKTVNSSKECLDIAQAIMAKLAQAQKPQSQQKPDKGQGDDQKENGQQEESDSSEGDPSDDQEEGESQGQAGGDSDEGDASPERGADGSPGDSERDTQGGAEGEETESPASGCSDQLEQDPQEQAKALEESRKQNKAKPGPSLEGLVNEHIDEWIGWEEEKGVERYQIFSEAFDEEQTFSSGDRVRNTKLYEQLKSDVRRYIGTMASQLEMALIAQTQTRWVPGERTGRRFDRRRLNSWMMGSDDDRIYRMKVEGEKLDTAVVMLWDCSGSMGSSDRHRTKASLARLAAVAFHESLKSVQIPHEVLGFDSGGKSHPELDRLATEAYKRGENLGVFSRVNERNNHYVYVPFGQTDGRAICDITGRSANRDGEAVLWAAKRLAARPEKRKILIVGSDGRPAGAIHRSAERNYLREVVQRVMSAGIEVFGLGIMDSSVKDYYPHWAVVNKANELPRAVMAQLLKHLTVQGMRHGAGPIRSTAATP